MNEKERVHLPFFGIGKLIPYMAPYKWPMMCMVTLGLMSTAVDVTIPLFQEYALSTFIGKGSLDTLSSFIMAYAGLLIFQVVVNLISCYQTCYVEMCIGRDMKRAAFNHLQTLSFSYFNHSGVYTEIKRIYLHFTLYLICCIIPVVTTKISDNICGILHKILQIAGN